MRMLLSLLGTCACLANAIQITAPVFNSTQSAGDSVTVQWTSVDTDPAIFSIELVNFVIFPPSYVILAYGVQTSSLSYTVKIPCDTAPAYGYQINAINGTNVFVIYAQSQNFTITEATYPAQCVSSSLTPSSCACGPPQTATVTAGGCPQFYAANTYPPNYNNLPSASITPPGGPQLGYTPPASSYLPQSSAPPGVNVPPASTYPNQPNTPGSTAPSNANANVPPTSTPPYYASQPKASSPPYYANTSSTAPPNAYAPSSTLYPPKSPYPKKPTHEKSHQKSHQSASGYQPAAYYPETTTTTTTNVQPTYNQLATSSAPPYGYNPYNGA